VHDFGRVSCRLKLAVIVSATKELENPQETAEKIGLAALIIQV
jgi:hypothetical protein